MAVIGYEQKRDDVRRCAWVANATKTFDRNKVLVIERKPDGTEAVSDADNECRPVLVDIASRRTDAEAKNMANASFAARPALLWFVAVNGGGEPQTSAGARIQIMQRDGPMQSYRELDRLPDQLLHDGGATQINSSALILLGWSQAKAAPECITAMAAAALDP